MRWSKRKLIQFGYTDFVDLPIATDHVQIAEAAAKDGEPFVAICSQRDKSPKDCSEIPGLPLSVRYLVVEGGETIYARNTDGSGFQPCLTLPKADGAVWGYHSDSDLIPLVDIRSAVEQAQGLTRGGSNEAIGFLLGAKLIDETSGETLRFRLPEQELKRAGTAVADWMSAFGLGASWAEASTLPQEVIGRIVMAWQPYGFLPAARTDGVFSLLLSLLSSREGVAHSIPQQLVRLIHTLLPGAEEPICIAGPGAAGLLDIPLLADKRVTMVGRSRTVVEQLGRALLRDFEQIPDDFLSLDDSRQWPTMVCLPPFGATVTDAGLLERSELAGRGQGKRSTMARSEEVWLEQAYRLLSEGGALFILLSDGFLSNASSRFAREWALERFQVDSVFSLPSSFSLFGSNVRSSLVRLRKSRRPPEAYQLFMAELDESDFGHLSEIIDAYRATTEERVK